jgi:maltose O-acetyltransferase
MGAKVLDKHTIGRGCLIGAGAVVTHDLPDRVLALGVPAKVVKTEIELK